MRVEEILGKIGLSYEELNSAERDTLTRWMKTLESKTLDIDGVKQYICSMRDSVELELVDEPEFNYIFIFRFVNRKHIMLKSRLKNYMLLLNFLEGPARAKEALERGLSGLMGAKK